MNPEEIILEFGYIIQSDGEEDELYKADKRLTIANSKIVRAGKMISTLEVSEEILLLAMSKQVGMNFMKV